MNLLIFKSTPKSTPKSTYKSTYQLTFRMRAIFLLFFILVSMTPSYAEMSRREFLRNSGACVLFALMTSSENSESEIHSRDWSIRSTSDIETLGLDSFGSAVKELLATEKYILGLRAIDKVRWKVQERLWKMLEPKTAAFKPTRARATVAIRIGKERYIYLRPSFRIVPMPSGNSNTDRTVGKIEYLNDASNPRMMIYWIGGPSKAKAKDKSTIVIESDGEDAP